MRAPAIPFLVLLLLAPSQAPAQATRDSRPAAAASTRPKERGTPDLLKKLLAEHAEAIFRKTKESLARAAEIDQTLLDIDWSSVDVPKTSFEFCVSQEQKKHDRKIEGWDFLQLPPCLAKLTTSGVWAEFVEKRLDALTDNSGTISWKSPKAWRNQSSEMIQARAFEKVASHLATGLAKDLQSVPATDLKRIRDAFFRIYEQYDVSTVQKSTQYVYLPAGYYLQWAGWIGDPRAWKIATDITDAWFAMPRDVHLPNFEQAVRAIDFFNNQLDPGKEPVRGELIRKIKADSRTPDSVKATIKTAP
jgi:hypothetical protein